MSPEAFWPWLVVLTLAGWPDADPAAPYRAMLFLAVVLLIAALRVVWLGWTIRFKSPLDIINEDLARQRARRRR